MLTKDRDTQKQLDELIIAELLSDRDPLKSESLMGIMDSHGITYRKYVDHLANHFFLAPRNLLRAQLLLFALVVSIVLALAAVRMGTEYSVVLLFFLLSVALGLPYIFFYLLQKGAKRVVLALYVNVFSLVYTTFLSTIFVIISIELGLLGVILIPIIVVVFYVVEIHKLTKLVKLINSRND